MIRKRLAVRAANVLLFARPGVFRLAAAASVWLFCGPLAADQVTSSLTSRAEAAATARKQGRLLLVVQFSGDFTQNTADTAEAQLYWKLILGNSQVAEALASRFVVVLEQVGDAKVLPRFAAPNDGRAGSDKSPTAKASPRPLEMAVAYFCLPDERVLHMAPGFVSADEFLVELAWVEQVYSRLVHVGDAEMAAELHAAHREMLDPKDLANLATAYPTRWTADAAVPDYATVELPQALAAARAVCDWMQRQRLGVRGPFNLSDRMRRPVAVARSSTLSGLAAHGRLGQEFAHLILAEYPLAFLSDLSGPTYETCTGQRCWQVSPRRAELAGWWATAARQGQRTMLIVSADVPAPDRDVSELSDERINRLDGAQPPILPDADAIALAELWRVASRVVTIDELATLLADAKLAPLAYDPAVGPPHFLLHDARGFRCGELAASEADAQRLMTLLRTIVGGPGRKPAIARAEVAGARRGQREDRVAAGPGDQNEGESNENP